MIYSLTTLTSLLFASSVIASPTYYFPSSPGPANTTRIQVGNALRVGDKLLSPDGSASLAIQPDGDICIFKTNQSEAVWCDKESRGLNVQYLAIDDGDGKLCARGVNTPWCFPTSGKAEYAELTNDGKLQLFGHGMIGST